MHKILRIIYGMLKNKTSFDPQIDCKNREKKKESTPQKPAIDKSRHYQDYDAKAPISKRQSKKRKERKGAQSGHTTESGILASVPKQP